jgi:hypothetical protein
MNAIAEGCSEHAALREAYREALQKWTRIRAVDLPDAAQVLEATRKIEELERLLKDHRGQHGC